jgi:hypothetical protein
MDIQMWRRNGMVALPALEEDDVFGRERKTNTT